MPGVPRDHTGGEAPVLSNPAGTQHLEETQTKRSHLVLVAAAAALAVGSSPALAKPKAKAAPAPKPVAATYYLHGTNNYGNQDTFPLTAKPLTMDATKPSGSTAKEIALVGGNAGGGALTVPKACPGGPYIPMWSAPLSGKLTQKVTVTFFARGTGGNVNVQLLTDPTDCNSPLVVAAEKLVAITAGPTPTAYTAVLDLPPNGQKVASGFAVQFLTDQTTSPGAAALSGISYDSTSAMSSVAFTCLPSTGKKTC